MKPSNELIRKEPGTNGLDRPVDSNGIPHSYNYGVDPSAENEVHLLDYWNAVRKRLWLVLGIVALITMLWFPLDRVRPASVANSDSAM